MYAVNILMLHKSNEKKAVVGGVFLQWEATAVQWKAFMSYIDIFYNFNAVRANPF